VIPGEEYELDQEYGRIVRGARERLNLTQEQLARLVSEKASVISAIERGRLKPDFRIARKLEHALRARILLSPGTCNDRERRSAD